MENTLQIVVEEKTLHIFYRVEFGVSMDWDLPDVKMTRKKAINSTFFMMDLISLRSSLAGGLKSKSTNKTPMAAEPTNTAYR